MPLQVVQARYKPQPLSAQTRVHQFAIFPAPVLGLDTSTPLTEQNPRSATALTNFFTRRYGSELRPGWRRWTTNLGGVGTESPVVTVMAYQPPRGAGSVALAKLFAACEDGKIYDVSSQTSEATVPAAVLTVTGQTEPGEWSYTNFATAATNYLCAVSANSGAFSYYTYDHTGGWVNRTASITGTAGAVNSFDFIMVWKNRIWFLAENSNVAWYLPVGAITGAAASFDFGPLLIHGGELRAMASWTLDSGDGIDDKLVISASQGDILIYGGTDPASASTFGIVGRWYVGPPPSGRRFMSKYGGDLALLCENGVEYMSHLTAARGLIDPETQSDDTPSRRYNEVIGQDIRDTRNQKGWALIHVPSEQSVLITTPTDESPDAYQYCFSTIPMGWSKMQNIPMKCSEVFDGNLYFGTEDGKIGKAFSGDTDDELSDGTAGEDVVGRLQTAFVTKEDQEMLLKRMQLVMPMFQSSDPPSFSVRLNTEWSDQGTSGSPPFVINTNALWDVGTWDVAVWGGAANTYLGWIGVEGLGCYASLRISIVGKPRTMFTSWKLVYEPGGIM